MFIIPRSQYAPFRSPHAPQPVEYVKLADVIAKAMKKFKAAFERNMQKPSGKPQPRQVNRIWRSK